MCPATESVDGVPRNNKSPFLACHVLPSASYSTGLAGPTSAPLPRARKKVSLWHFQVIYSHCLREQKHVILEQSEQLVARKKKKVQRSPVGGAATVIEDGNTT